MKTNDINKFIDFSIEAFRYEDNEFYTELGVSKDIYLNDKLKMIKQLKLKSIAQTNKAKNENMLELAIQKMKNIVVSANENIKEELSQLIHSRSPQFQFRNVEKLDENDLKELLSDLNIIEIIEDLEKLNNDNK
jgi:hypothetical protein